jgi:hypothetical protein
MDGILYFRANDGTNGIELWSFDPAEYDPLDPTSGLHLYNINPGSGTSKPSSLITLDGILYFQASDGTNGFELWSFNPAEYDPLDPTSGLHLHDINPGSGSSSPYFLTAMDGILYFRANDGTNGIELWSLS